MYVRRFLADPGDAVLLNIESVNILDLSPPQSIQGVGSGVVILVGEFENGPFNLPQQALGTNDFTRTYGTLGYQYGGTVAKYPSAPVRRADGGAAEFWNGNAFVQISGLTFAALIAVRVDTSVGTVLFESRAYIEGVAEFSYVLASGQVLALTVASLTTTVTQAATLPQSTINVASTTGFPASGTLTIDGATVTYTGVTAKTFTGCSGGTVTMQVGDLVLEGSPVSATFTGVAASVAAPSTAVTTTNVTLSGTGQTLDVTASTNFPATGSFTDVTSGATGVYTGKGSGTLTGCTGTGTCTVTDVIVPGAWPTGFVGGETLVLAADGQPNFTVVFQLADQSVAQVVSRINSYAGFTLASAPGGILTLTGRTGGLAGSVQVVSGSSGVLGKLGLVAGTTAGTGNVQNIGNVAVSEIQSIVQAAVSGSKVELNAAGALRISNTSAPGVGGIGVGSATTALNLGFVVAEAGAANDNLAGTIPAGTVVTDASSSNVLVTMQDVAITAGNPGPYPVKVRYAVDDGTGAGTGASTIVSVQSPPVAGSYAVENPQPITAALTESQIDAAYTTAIQATTSVNSVTRIANLIVSARQSNTVRSQLKQNALSASANGSYGRLACVSPPLNTGPSVAMGPSAPGVVATRDQRVVYCYIGQNAYVPLIGQVGVAGGTGFNATGNVDLHSDVLMASICSQLPPEEDPGQQTTFTANVNGIETGSNVQGFDINDYIAFKAAGIAALRIDEGVAVFQSGVTSVDPTLYPELTDINRRRMADFIEDSIATPAKAYGKKLSLQARRKALKGEIRAFMAGLLAKNNPGAQRIGGYTVSDSDGNTDPSLGAGMYRITVAAKTLSSLKSIVIQVTAGDSVVVQEVLPAAA